MVQTCATGHSPPAGSARRVEPKLNPGDHACKEREREGKGCKGHIGHKGHINGLFGPRMARNETWRPLWKAKEDLDREKEVPQDRSESADGLQIRGLACREGAR